MEGRKDDTGKLRFDLIPAGPLNKLAEVYTIGARKYADRNWEKGIAWSRIFAAMQRHAWKFWNGERYDQQDGQEHLASVAWCAFALLEYLETHNELDDRPRRKQPVDLDVERAENEGMVGASSDSGASHPRDSDATGFAGD